MVMLSLIMNGFVAFLSDG